MQSETEFVKESLSNSRQNYQDLLQAYQYTSAGERRDRDALVERWRRDIKESRDRIHEYLQQIGVGHIAFLHGSIDTLDLVIEFMELFLNHAGGRRK